MIDIIAFDADDTLWHNEILYRHTQEQMGKLLSTYIPPDQIEELLFQTEMRNLPFYGYGIKSFTLSMIETAIKVSDGQVTAQEIRQILDLAKEMISSEVTLIDGASHAVSSLANGRRLMLVTKGDLLDQERKLARSGLAQYFDDIEIVSEKTSETYHRLLHKYGIQPEQFLMVGNSLKSDVLPVLEIGGIAVYVPYHITWDHEKVADADHNHHDYFTLDELGKLPALIHQIEGKA
ncbi:MAG: HAD family hydrolase [Anaerolineales bacterium]|nr:HAD family hydrolase [Anaerolineales bacterium]